MEARANKKQIGHLMLLSKFLHIKLQIKAIKKPNKKEINAVFAFLFSFFMNSSLSNSGSFISSSMLCYIKSFKKISILIFCVELANDNHSFKNYDTKEFFNFFFIKLVLIELLLLVIFPILLLIVISLFFLIYAETFEEIHFGKREVGLLVIGSVSTMFFDLPIFLYSNYFLAINVGGALIPIILSFYFIKENALSFWKVLAGIVMVGIVTYMVTFVTDVGVVSYFPFYFLPSLMAILLSFLFFFRNPKTCVFAYTISTLGVIIGGDFSHLPELFEFPFMGSMGGAGIYDMVYLAGLISFCASFPFIRKKRLSRAERNIRKIEREAYYAGKIAGIGGDYRHIIRKLTGRDVEEIKKRRLISEINRPLMRFYASPLKRIVAFLIDSTIVFPVSVMLLLIFHMELYIFLSIFLLIQIFYFTCLEFYFGSTIGKAILDIEVRNVANEKADFMTIFTRNIIRILEFFAMFYLVSVLLIVATPKRQRIGDIIADSIVVEVK